MRRALLLLGIFVASPAHADPKATGTVVVELFSSEGCSSCPPADELVRMLDSEGVIALEFHVDYWNDLGWADPFSKPEWSARQRMYGKSYTPQAVIDGTEELVGSRDGAVREAIERAARKPHLAVTITRDKESLVVRIPAATMDEKATVQLAVAERNLSTSVLRGENAGRTLKHGPIVRELRALAPFTGSGLELRTVAGPAPRRFVAFVQGEKTHRIFGAALL